MNSRKHRKVETARAASNARELARAIAPVLPLAVRRHDRGTLACLGSAR